MSNWLKYIYDEGTLLSRIIYTYHILDYRMDRTSIKNLNMFKKLCSFENLGNVILATTMWNKVLEVPTLDSS